jgi:hypothetical protein
MQMADPKVLFNNIANFRNCFVSIYAVEDRTPRVYPWMNELGGGIIPP